MLPKRYSILKLCLATLYKHCIHNRQTDTSKKIKVSSKYHTGECGPCYLCGKEQMRYDHFGSLSTEAQVFLQRHTGTIVPDSSCLCRSHQREEIRHRSDLDYVPLWKKHVEKTADACISKCVYPDCAATAENAKIIVPSTEYQSSFAKVLNTSQGTVKLCNQHYQALYQREHSHDPCAGCGLIPKVRQSAFYRHSPDAATVCEILNTNTEFNVCLTEEDTLCKSCYDLHLVILKNLKKEQQTSQQSLHSCLIQWSMTLSDDSNSLVYQAVLATVIHIAKLLLQDKAILLPQAATFFHMNYPVEEENSCLCLDVGDGTITFTNKWLLNQLILHLEPHMSYRCAAPRLGTVLYPRNGDLLKCLTHALYQCTPQEQEPERPHLQNGATLLHEAGVILNDALLQETRKHRDRALDLTSFNLDDCIEEINPLIWDFVCLCTRSYREKTSRTHDENSHTKKVRNFAIICMLMFATNSSCDTIMHHLVADTVEMCSGSRNLVSILNRLGVCVSSDTHDRFVTLVAEKQQKASVWSELTPDVFTIVSVDNIDFLQRHATVYHGALSRSYHGTTIQIVQPVPTLKLMPNATHECEQSCSTLSSIALADISNCTTVTSSKRQASGSPASSPHKNGKFGPKRRRTVQLPPTKLFSATYQAISNPLEQRHTMLTVDNFIETTDESQSRLHISLQVFAYFLQKHALQSQSEHGVLKPLREFLIPTPAQLAYHEQSSVYYMELLDENADSEETMAEVAEMVSSRIMSETQPWLILVGDGKTYEHLGKVKRLYGSALSNILIFPGDWHILKNFQPVIMKAYFHVGLREIANASGYKAETLKSLESCSHFKRTHTFLVQVWEVMYLEMISAFLGAKPQFNDIKAKLQCLLDEHSSDHRSPVELLTSVQELIAEEAIWKEFNSFIELQSERDSTWKVWANFVFNDCFCYVNLFLSIRMSNWDLRLSSLKRMAPLFSAYDRPCYQRLLPKHIADTQVYPKEVVDGFRAGGFTVKLKGEIGHAVALDECHEMCINRDLKMAVVRPSTAYLKKTTSFFSYRIKAHKQLTTQLFPSFQLPENNAVWDNTIVTKHWEENVSKMRSIVIEHCLFNTQTESDRGLLNVFTNTKATLEQAHDILNARKIGHESYINYITYYLLQLPSMNAPIRRKQLLTMAPAKITKRKMTQKEREQRETIKCMRKRLAWCNQTGEKFDESEEQYSVLPRSLANFDCSPQKGSKSKWTDKLKGRYKAIENPFLSKLDWVPEVVIIDAMFLINTTPLRQHKTLEHYSDLLFRQYAVPHYVNGTIEVHLVFDCPSRVDFNPKFYEQKRRDSQTSGRKNNHTHHTFSTESSIPRPWRDYLDCRKCKRSMIESLAIAFCKRAGISLKNRQKLILTGCMTNGEDYGWELTAGNPVPKLTTEFSSNSPEADMRVWRHASQVDYKKILIYSPDTDVYNIGLTLLKPGEQYMYVTQINLPQNPPRYVHINKLVNAFKTDPDLATIPKCKIPNIIQQLYICTGCDYVSYVAGIGKATFLNVLFQHASFITGSNSNGDLSMTTGESMDEGFLSVIRLFGTVYFKKHLAIVVSRLGFNTPCQLFNSIQGNTEEKHKDWYMRIRGTIPVMSEEERPPTITALHRHWKRCCWINNMWRNSSKANLYDGLAEPQSSGWIKDENGDWHIDWEAIEVEQRITRTIDFLNKGCGCKKGCGTMRCGCRKNGRQCGVSCECQGCTNMNHTQSSHDKNEEETEDLDDDSEQDEIENEDEEDLEAAESDSDDENIETEIITGAIDADEEMYL